MKEVSCRALDPYFRFCDRRGIARAELATGVPYTVAQLQDKNERIDYDAFLLVMGNARRFFSDDDFIEIGATGMHSPLVRSFVVIGRTLLSPAGFYRWVLASGGPASQMNTTLVPSTREERPGHLVVDVRTAPGYAPSREYNLMAWGGMREMPRLLGLAEARVVMTETERGMRLEIDVPPERGLRSRVLKLISTPFNARAAASDLEEALRTLQTRYAELESARNEVERQRALLATAYRIGNAIWAEREPQVIARDVTRELTSVDAVRGARLHVSADDGDLAGEAGDLGGVAEAVVVDLIGRRIKGRLEAWTRVGGDREEVGALCALIAPTAALAIDNAIAYRELAQYQRGLEALVDERTAELRSARDELTDLVAQLREAQSARERIFANISHEIRTPLSVILLAVGDVEARAGSLLDDGARADLATVVESTRRLLRLVDELLLLAAGRETALRVEPRPTDLASLLAAMIATWRPAAEAAGLSMSLHAPERLAVMIDPVAIERVVSNLVSNAVKFTPRGGRVEVELTQSGAWILLAVRDTGIGIDDELRARLFGRFERGSSKQQARGGSGIGLSLVKELIEAHGGSVSAERVRGGGTELIARLPAIEAGAPAEDRALALRPGDFGLTIAPVATGDVLVPPGRSAATILVAEDDPRLASMIGRLLAEEYTVVIALDGLAALELAARHEPHLLVTDVDMPGMDGVALTRRFRERSGEKLAPVVILSAVADLGTRVAGLEAGAVDYVVKPFNPPELRARVRSQLAMRDLALRLHRAEQLSALGTLSSGLAHELRNPANAIVNAVGPLKRLLPTELTRPEAPVGELVDVLASCAEQIAFLSRQLLSFRRGGDLELREVALAELIQRAVTLSQPALREVTVRELGGVVEPVRCAPPLMVQVFSNLIDNAAQAAGAGGWVEIASSVSDGHVSVEIGDSGAGVPTELRNRVFEPFFTTKPPGMGTGLGLPLARDIVHRHGGILEIRERDRRSVFVIEWPR